MLERSIEGGYWASATEPQLLGEITDGLEDIEKDGEQSQELFTPGQVRVSVLYVTWAEKPGTDAGQG